ncbi:65-kDa microtubule-associated protein 3-like [Senna tora]|uniref:65-kDa microtubule-associated protein 3-like n=1 Tax=Senna tora TaxID=362788 RepID=A0A834TGR2_9FABA|nr:65-kDa microtubule-associated protein 3-like [Senna tora]
MWKELSSASISVGNSLISDYVICRWKSPPPMFFKLNFNVSLREGVSAGVGCVIRNEKGRILATMAKRLPEAASIEELEVEALCLGSKMARDLSIRKIEIEGDLNKYSKMSKVQNDPLLQVETTCGSLLYELQIIWDEVGESETERDKMLLELERECLEVYRRKVDQANRSRAQLRQAIADSEAELAAICSAMGERPVHIRQSDQKAASLKEELERILPELDEMRKRKSERRVHFIEVQEQILIISNEIHGSQDHIPAKTVADESDLSLRKLEELHRELQTLKKEKSDRLQKIQDHLYALNSLCLVLGLDFKQIISEIHPSLGDNEGPKSVTNDTIQQLAVAIQNLREVKLQRMQRLQDLATTMLELWNLMDTPIEEQQMFQNVTCNVAASEHEITEPNTLSVDFINYVEAEVSRLEELKASKMKELVFKKRAELEEICRKMHLVPDIDTAVEYAVEAIESGSVDPACVLEQIELQISKVKEEAFSRKEILEKVEKWLTACDEESWLEEYNRDENRYNAGRGAHLTLKRAEKARALVNKLPAMVDALASKTVAWEKDKGVEFTYDGIRLLSMLEEYTILREEKEQERRRQRDLKKLQGQLIAEQEALYGSKPSPSKTQTAKKAPRMSTGGASSRRVSLGGAMVQTPKTAHSRPQRKTDHGHHIDNHLDDSVSSLSSVRRGLDIAGVPAKKQSFGGAGGVRDIQSSPMMRQPFSPISSTLSSKANMKNPTTDELNTTTTHSDKFQKTIAPTTTLPFTPSKTAPPPPVMADEENRTPKSIMPNPSLPTTPSTVSAPMNMAITPAHHHHHHPPPPLFPIAGGDSVKEIEYSFEERRLGFVVLA